MASLIDQSGTKVFEGTIENGGSQPIAHEELYGSPVSIADGGSERLPWNSSGGPDSLLDISTPAIPTIITAGVYSFQVSVLAGAAMSIDAWCGVQLKLDGAGFNASAYTDSRPANVVPTPGTGPLGNDSSTPVTSIAFTWYMPAGARVEVWVSNIDGTHATNFLIGVAHVQRLS